MTDGEDEICDVQETGEPGVFSRPRAFHLGALSSVDVKNV